MPDLSPNDAAVLARVARFPTLGEARRTKMLARSSNQAKAIGRIIIKGARTGDKVQYKRAARKIESWADENAR
jgi:hypothetical protein